MRHFNLFNKEIHEWYVPAAKFANILSKSFVSFIKLIGVDSHQIESILNSPFVNVQEQVKSFGNNWLEGMPFSINVQGLDLTPTLYRSARNHIALKPTVTWGISFIIA